MTDDNKPIPPFRAGKHVSSRLRRTCPDMPLERPPRFKPTLAHILEHGTEPVAGGHLIWKHGSRNIQLNGKTVAVQRAVWEARYETELAGRSLLNHCLVPGCIAPQCHTATRFTKWADYVRHEHTSMVNPTSVAIMTPLDDDEGTSCQR